MHSTDRGRSRVARCALAALALAAGACRAPEPAPERAPEEGVVLRPGASLDAEARARLPATVYVLLAVQPDGTPSDPVVQSSPHPALDGPALEAVGSLRFAPGRRDGQAVPVRVRVPVRFLEDRDGAYFPDGPEDSGP